MLSLPPARPAPNSDWRFLGMLQNSCWTKLRGRSMEMVCKVISAIYCICDVFYDSLLEVLKYTQQNFSELII